MAATQKAAVLPKKGHSFTDGQNVTIKLDIVPSEQHNGSNTITDHPVEEGANISDHVRPDPDMLTLECLITNTPLDEPVDFNRAQNAHEAMRKLKDAGVLVTVFTTLGRYDSMAIQNVSETRTSETYNALSFTIAFKRIRIVRNKLTKQKVSRQKNVSEKVKTGAQTPEDPDEVERSAMKSTENALGKAAGLQGF